MNEPCNGTPGHIHHSHVPAVYLRYELNLHTIKIRPSIVNEAFFNLKQLSAPDLHKWRLPISVTFYMLLRKNFTLFLSCLAHSITQNSNTMSNYSFCPYRSYALHYIIGSDIIRAANDTKLKTNGKHFRSKQVKSTSATFFSH